MTDRRVAILVRHQGRLFLRRDDETGVEPIPTHLDGDPRDSTREWIQQRDSPADFTVVRIGDAVRGETGGEYVPVLLDSESGAVSEQADGAWVDPTELDARETVPWLWSAYDAVRPSVATVADDTEHGSATLSRRALEVLRDEAISAARTGPESAGATQVRDVARAVRDARPSMAVVRNRINRVMSSLDPTAAPAEIATAAQAGIERSIRADRDTAQNLADEVDEARVATLSRSGTILRVFDTASPESVLVPESRPGGEGIDVAESLAAQTDVTLTTDAAFPTQLSEWGVDGLLVGADAIGPDGRVRNKVGTCPAAAAATQAGIPVLVAAATDKISPELDADSTTWPTPLYDGDAPLSTANPVFDVTPPGCVDAIVTERGRLTTDEVAAIAADHERRERWDEPGHER
jgi:translation initiation factor 2B subunit (eIF-2B alpha/beta/delta family)